MSSSGALNRVANICHMWLIRFLSLSLPLFSPQGETCTESGVLCFSGGVLCTLFVCVYCPIFLEIRQWRAQRGGDGGLLVPRGFSRSSSYVSACLQMTSSLRQGAVPGGMAPTPRQRGSQISGISAPLPLNIWGFAHCQPSL